MIQKEMKDINVKLINKSKDLSMCWGEFNYVNSYYMPIVF